MGGGDIGLKKHRRRAEARVWAHNRATLTPARQLEGPGSEARLSRLRSRFAAISSSIERSRRAATLWAAGVIFVALFALTLVVPAPVLERLGKQAEGAFVVLVKLAEGAPQ